MTTTEPLLERQIGVDGRGVNGRRVNGRRGAGRAVDGRGITVLVLWVSAAAWVGVLVVHGLHHGTYAFADRAAHDHGGTHHPVSTAEAGSAGGPVGLALWVSGWIFMVVAMMLPPALPLLRVARRLVVRRRHSWLLVSTTAVAFVGVWLGAGVAFAAGDVALRLTVRSVEAMRDRPQLVSAAAAMLAGAYQFSGLKKACLTACRSPLGLAMTTWTGSRPVAVSAAYLGARFGLVCVGCCWALMLLTFTVGAAAMPVMVVTAAVMALERLLPRIRPLVPLVGVAAIALGVLLLASVLPAGLTA